MGLSNLLIVVSILSSSVQCQDRTNSGRRTSPSSIVHFPSPSASRVNQQFMVTSDPFPAILILPNMRLQVGSNGQQLINSRDRVANEVVRPSTSGSGSSFGTGSGTNSNRNKLTALKFQDYDELKVKVRDMTSASEFFEALGAPEPFESEDGGRERRPSRVKFTDQAGCEPENRTIDLVNYTSTIDDPSVAIFPRCIRVPRCGGCCYPSHLFECLPVKTSIKKVVRGMVRLNSAMQDPSTGRRRRESAVMETIDIEVHESCKCQCKVMESDCDDEKHIYRPELCSCMCSNIEEQNDCIERGFSHIWDSKDCICRCRNRRHCSTGLIFNEDECDCTLP